VAVIKRLFTAKRAVMPARSIRSPRAACRSRSATPPRRCRSLMDGARPTASRALGRGSAYRRCRGPGGGFERAAARAGGDRALLPGFVGAIEQVPPRYSAIKIEGERAYDIARDGENSSSSGW